MLDSLISKYGHIVSAKSKPKSDDDDDWDGGYVGGFSNIGFNYMLVCIIVLLVLVLFLLVIMKKENHPPNDIPPQLYV
jgi:uncharacterized membrane protein